MKIKAYDITATWFYSGYLRPASGMWGAFAALPLCLLVVAYAGLYGVIIVSFALFLLGLWAAHCYEIETGEHDSSRIVIDEVVGMLLASLPLLYDLSWMNIALCFAAFRLFDALKIGPVGWLDRHVRGAFGVMIDDVAAGLMAAIVVFGGMIWIF